MDGNINAYTKGTSFCTRTRFSEFLIAFCILLVGLACHTIPPRLRALPGIPVRISTTNTVFVLDPNFNEKMKDEQVPIWLLVIFAYGLPLLSIAIVTLFTQVNGRHIPHDTRDFLLSFMITSAVSISVTAIVKTLAGAFRPSFFELCGWDMNLLWDGVANLCTEDEDNARKSFPSGHASASFAGLYFLTVNMIL